MSTKEGAQVSLGKAAWRCITRHFDTVSTVAIVQLAVHAAVILPLFLSVDFGGRLPAWMCWAGAAALYIALLIPLRFWAREKMRRRFYTRNLPRRKRNPYEKWLKTGLVRYLRGLLWGLPFLAGCVYFTIVRRVVDYNTFWMPVRSLAVLAGQEPNIGTGLVIACALMAVFACLFAYGWWRDMAVEYLPVRSLGVQKTIHWAKRILKNYRGRMRKNTLVNMLLSLPAVIGFGAVLVPYVRSQVDFSLSGEMVFNLLLRMLRTPLPSSMLLKLAAVFAVLYLPLWVYRKTRNAALMARLMKENVHHIHHSEHHSHQEATKEVAPKIVHLEGTPLSDEPAPVPQEPEFTPHDET